MITEYNFNSEEDHKPSKVYSINSEDLGTDDLQHFLDTLFDTNQEDADHE